MMRTVAQEYDRVVGVDTHAATTHTMTLLIAATGGVLEQRTFRTSAAGLQRTFGWIGSRTSDQSCLVVVEGTGSYGAQLTEHLTQAGGTTAEAPIPARGPKGRSRGLRADSPRGAGVAV